MKCKHCEKPLKIGDNYIEYEGCRYCDFCYEGYTTTAYTVGGEPLALDDDGVIEYNFANEEGGEL